MKVGIFFSSELTSGGAYRYQTTFLDVLKLIRKDNIVIITSNKYIINKYHNDFQILDLSKYSRFLNPMKTVWYSLIKNRNNRIDLFVDNKIDVDSEKSFPGDSGILNKIYYNIFHYLIKINGIGLVIYPGPSDLSFKLNIPYIFTVYDLQHKIHPEFPEVSINGVFEEREFLYSNALPKAMAIIADSQVGKEDIVNLYNIDPEKIFVLPYLPPTYLNNLIKINELTNIKSKYSLPDQYIFYPANFWPHKNHKLIIRAIAILREKDIVIHAVFVGSKMDEWGEFKKVMELAYDLDVVNQVHYLGYVENEEISTLYKLSTGLVMPTFFGPTNIPYLEAFYLDCPVITSNIRGIKEQVGDAAILVNPTSPEDLAEAIKKLQYDEKLRNKLIKNGHKVLDSWNYADFSNGLACLLDYCTKRVRQ